MHGEGGANLFDTPPMSAWTLVTELPFAGPFVDEAIQRAVVALLPAGPWAPLLQRSLTESVVAAILYMQHQHGTGLVQLQCFQLYTAAASPGVAPVAPSAPAYGGLVPTTQVGWSFFLLEKTSTVSLSSATPDRRAQRETGAKSPHAVVQIYLFHE